MVVLNFICKSGAVLVVFLLCLGLTKPESGPDPCPEFCNQPSSRGGCQRSKTLIKNRWYFDSTEGKCDRFVYGGCGGNENRFLRLEECQNVCEKRCQVGYGLEFGAGNVQDFEAP